jgi:predicted nucleotidyltransferase
MTKAVDPIMSRFHAALDKAYGPRLERVVLFGSRARGDARPDSDYDVAVFLENFEGLGQEADRIAEIETDILYDTGAVINALPFEARAYMERTGLMGRYAAKASTYEAGGRRPARQGARGFGRRAKDRRNRTRKSRGSLRLLRRFPCR